MKRKNMFLYIAKVLSILGIGATVGTIILEKHLLVAHLGVHFQFQYWVLVLLSFMIFVFTRYWKGVFILSVYLLLSYVYILHPIALFSLSDPEEVDILYMNTHYSNSEPENIAAYVKEKNPGIIALTETNPQVVHLIDEFRHDQIINHRAYASSCTLYGTDFESNDVANLTHLPICTVIFPDYDLLLVHAHRPLGEANLKENLNFFDIIKKQLDTYQEEGRKFVLVGDFNSSNYSRYFRDRFGEYLHQNRYTWMTHTPLTLPIDHVITNMETHVQMKRIPGSDHAALLIDIIE